MDALKDILLPFSLAALLCGGVAGVVAGAAMLISRDAMVRLNRRGSQWLGFGTLRERLDQPHRIERYVYRHHRLAGCFLLFGAAVVLRVFLFGDAARRIFAAVAVGNWWLLNTFIGLLLIGSVMAALVGAIVLVKPSLLREIEEAANRWIPTGRTERFFSGMRHSLEQYLLRHNKTVGLFMIAGGLYILVELAPLLWSGGWKL